MACTTARAAPDDGRYPPHLDSLPWPNAAIAVRQSGALCAYCRANLPLGPV